MNVVMSPKTQVYHKSQVHHFVYKLFQTKEILTFDILASFLSNDDSEQLMQLETMQC